ncbi:MULTISPECIES: hypothetical protein [unclassified Janthinobacterium]|uniref:hypothetical protein n=1 Tax=unclassified Janthinobacterium TaxID=2610881 RepID=UPI0003495538|nr:MULTISPECIES: hypothetical protein [unclassified Janthinobacterium]
MVLSDELLDVQGHVLLPQGTVLSEAMLALMPRHGIEMLPIANGAVSEEELASAHGHAQQRLARLFRHNDPDDQQDWASGLLRRFVEDYRLGKEPAP